MVQELHSQNLSHIKGKTHIVGLEIGLVSISLSGLKVLE